MDVPLSSNLQPSSHSMGIENEPTPNTHVAVSPFGAEPPQSHLAVPGAANVAVQGQLTAGAQQVEQAQLQNSSKSNSYQKSPEVLIVLETAYKENPYPLKNKETKERLVNQTGLQSGQLQDWFYRRRLKEIIKSHSTPSPSATQQHAAASVAANTSLEASQALVAVPTVEPAPPQPSTLEEARTLIGRPVLKYFPPVPALNYPGGNAAGAVVDVEGIIEIQGQDGQDQTADQAQSVIYVLRYGESYEERLTWDQLQPILVPASSYAPYAVAYDGGLTSEQAMAAGSYQHTQGDLSDAAGNSSHALLNHRRPPQKRHRPFRYIQLPVNMAHPLFGHAQFPLALTARMFVDNELVREITSASLIRCVHPRTQFGYQYQLYGVQEFRKVYHEKPLKVVNITKNEEGDVADVYFVNVVTNDGAWRATERDGAQMTKYRAPLIPSAFIQKSFPDAVYPMSVRIIVELNGETQPEQHTCTIHHDSKAKVYRLRDDKSLYNAYKSFDIAIDSWKKVDESTLKMCCRGQLKALGSPYTPDGHLMEMMDPSQMQQGSRKRGRPKRSGMGGMSPNTMVSIGLPHMGMTGLEAYDPEALHAAGMDPNMLAALASGAGSPTKRAAAAAGRRAHGQQDLMGFPVDDATAAAMAAAAAAAAAAANGLAIPGHHQMVHGIPSLADHATVASVEAALAQVGDGTEHLQPAEGGHSMADASRLQHDESQAQLAAALSSPTTMAAAMAAAAAASAVSGLQGVSLADDALQGVTIPMTTATGQLGHGGVEEVDEQEAARAAACRGLLALVMAGGGGTGMEGVAGNDESSPDRKRARVDGGAAVEVEPQEMIDEAVASGQLNPGAAAALAAMGAGMLNMTGISMQSAAAAAAAAAVISGADSGSQPGESLAATSLDAFAGPDGTSAEEAAAAAAAAAAASMAAADLGTIIGTVMQLVTSSVGYPATSDEGAALINQLQVILSSIVLGHHVQKDAAWQLVANVTDTSKAVSAATVLPEESKTKVVELLSDLVAGIMQSVNTLG